MKAMLFAAGYGTRMRPYTDTLPKPALPFMGKPLVAHTLAWLAEYGVNTVVINLHHKAEIMRQTALQCCPNGMQLHFELEAEILGTGGGLRAATKHFSGEEAVIVVNGDVFTNADLEAPLRVHRNERPGSTLLLTADPQHRELFGVGLDSHQRITDFWGHPESAPPERRCAYTGIHILNPAMLAKLPDNEFACIKEKGWIPHLKAGGPLRGVITDADWYDLGTPERYLNAHFEQLDRQKKARVGRHSTGLDLPPSTRIGDGLRMEGPARIGPRVCLGQNVTLRGPVELSNCVVWDNSVVEGTIDHQIITPAVEASDETRGEALD